MALSSIPQFRPVSPEEASPLYAAMKSFIPMYQQSQQMQMQKQQMGLQQQLAQMQNQRQQQQFEQSQAMAPFQQRKLQAETGLAEAKASGYPMQQQQAQQQQQAKMALGWAQNVLKANAADPNFSKDPANQQSLAQAMQIQNSFIGNMRGGQPQQMQQGPQMQQPMQGQQQVDPSQSGLGNLSGAMQPQAAPQEQIRPQLSPEYLQSIQADQKAQEGKMLKEQYTPDELNRISRIIPAKKAYNQAKTELKEIAPYLKTGQSIERAAENMASSTGIPLSEATIKINTFFNKTIKGLAKEMGPGFGVPTAEKAYKEFEKYIDPSSFGQPEQIMANFDSVGSLLDKVGQTLLKTPAQQIQEGKRLFGKKPKKGSTWNTNAQQQPQAQQLSPEHRQILLAEKQRRAALKSQGGV